MMTVVSSERSWNREDLAWAAGFFDGEGCFCYSQSGKYGCVSIGQSELEPLARFRQAVGLGKIYGPYVFPKTRNRLSKKPQYVFRVHGHEGVQAIAAMLWFQLSSIKTTQAIYVLSRTTHCRRGHWKAKGN